MQSQDRISLWMEFTKDRWEKELPAVRDEIIRQADEENVTLFKAFSGHGGCQKMFSQLLLMRWQNG